MIGRTRDGQLTSDYLTAGSSSFTDFAARVAPNVLPSSRTASPGLGDLAPHGTTIVAATFKGGVGSEMIEVVPFFHKMAYSIMERMEGESPEAIMATTITSYCLSSILTGLIFLTLGGFKLGTLVSFFPRHILIGCIGGVGFFLFVTGIEVSARIEGNLNYDLATLQKLFSADTWFLWTIPLTLAISIMIMQRMVKSPFVLPAFFVLIFATFYLFVKGIFRVDLADALLG